MDCGRPRQSVTVHERTICRKRHECSAELLTGSIVCVAMLRPRSAQRHGMVFRRRLRFLDGDRRFFFRDLAIRAHRNGEAILRGGLPWTFAASAESTHGPRRDHPTAQTRVWALPVEETPHLSLNWIGYFPCRAISRGAQTPNRVLVVCGAGRGVSSFAVATWQLGSLPPPSSQDHLRHLGGPRGQLSSYFHPLSVKSQAQKIVASRASVGTGRRFLAVNTWSVRRPTPTILAEISWPPTPRRGRAVRVPCPLTVGWF